MGCRSAVDTAGKNVFISRKKVLLFFIVLLTLSTCFSACRGSRVWTNPKAEDARPLSDSIVSRAFFLVSWKIKYGDGPDWAGKEFDDSDWENKPNIYLDPHPKGLFWLRKTLEIPFDCEESDPVTISFYNLPAAFEVYWDGNLIATNGRVGISLSDETPGVVTFIRIISNRFLQSGSHTLAIRASNFSVLSRGLFREISIGPWSEINFRHHSRIYPRLIFSSIFFLSSFLAFFFFFRRSGDPALFFFGLYAMLNCLHSVWILAVDFVPVTLKLFATAEPLEVAAVTLSYFFLFAFVLWHFKMRHAWLTFVLLSFLSLAGFVYFRDIMTATYSSNTVVSFFAFLVLISMTIQKKRGSLPVLAGTGLVLFHRMGLLFPALIQPLLQSIPGMILTIIIQGISLTFFLAAIALRLRDESRALQALQLRSQRLEADLLKKSIQPHFIMNTLLSIKSWFQRDQEKAEKLIEALAAEFRIINRISAERDIPLSEELDLCRNHLELMGYRFDVTYTLEVHGDCTGIRVPPLLLHTLVENGLTHSFSPRENGLFRFECRKTEKTMELILKNNGSRLDDVSRNEMSSIEEGMGLKYIRSRLEEVYPGHWTVEYGMDSGFWTVRFMIQKDGRK